MARKLDQLLVIDVEATCWSSSPPAGEVNEIIEIGICPIDLTTLTRLEKRSLFVKPERSSISEFCTQLTTITFDMVEGGMSFSEACRLLKREYSSPERPWASYGDYDRNQFQRQCELFKVPFPFGPTHINVKTLAALALGSTCEDGTQGVLAQFGMEFEGTHHRGGDDAWNIAAIMIELLKKLRV